MERKQTCPELQHSRKTHLPVLNMNVIDQNKPCSTASSIGTTQSFLLTCRNYEQYINRAYRRSGTLWEGRFRSCLTQSEDYVLACYRYIELSPVRANMVKHPGDYRWSSYRCNGEGKVNELITQHDQYQKLAVEEKERRAAYRELLKSHMDEDLNKQIREATNGNFVLGNDRFQKEIELMLGRRVTPGRSGRPRKE